MEKLRIINIPIEPLEERYSIDWDKWFYTGFTAANCHFDVINGTEVSSKIEFGSFLDVIQTNKYKTSQLQQIIQILENYKDDYTLVLFFQDIWDPGLETIAYIRDGMSFKNLKICGCLHAGSYDKYDFLNKTGMTSWAKYAEMGWFTGIVDKIFVATDFHKDLLCTERQIFRSKVKVTGFPIYTLSEEQIKKEKIVIFPHRLDSEKNPHLFDKLKEHFKKTEWKFIKTKEVVNNKSEYYSLLEKASIAVSFADQETWGIAMQEALFYGCTPVVPNKLSYKEMYPPPFRYNSFEECIQLVSSFMDNDEEECLVKLTKLDLLQRGEKAISNIINEINKL